MNKQIDWKELKSFIERKVKIFLAKNDLSEHFKMMDDARQTTIEEYLNHSIELVSEHKGQDFGDVKAEFCAEYLK